MVKFFWGGGKPPQTPPPMGPGITLTPAPPLVYDGPRSYIHDCMLKVTKFSITSVDSGGCIQFVFRIQKGRENNKGFLTRLVVYLCVGVCIGVGTYF